MARYPGRINLTMCQNSTDELPPARRAENREGRSTWADRPPWQHNECRGSLFALTGLALDDGVMSRA
jgi:hypothetical protein